MEDRGTPLYCRSQTGQKPENSGSWSLADVASTLLFWSQHNSVLPLITVNRHTVYFLLSDVMKYNISEQLCHPKSLFLARSCCLLANNSCWGCVGCEPWPKIANHRSPILLTVMRSHSISFNNNDGAFPFELWRWDEPPQYAPTPGNFSHTPSLPSNLSLINVNPTASIEYPISQSNNSQIDKLPLLQFGDWVEGKAYDEDPPSCIHYWIEWKVTLNNKIVIKDTEQDLVLAPGFYWRLFL